MSKDARIKHGMWQTPEFGVWWSMIKRCRQKSNPSYHRYGGRGIKVCKRWDQFINFYKDMGSRPKPNMSIDRINPNGNYCPKNCRWATPKEQANNRTNTMKFKINGRTLTASEVCRRYKMRQGNLWYRIKVLGLSINDAIKYKSAPKFKFNGQMLSKRKIAQLLGVNRGTFQSATEKMSVQAAIKYYQSKNP